MSEASNDILEVTRSAGFFSPNVGMVAVRQRYGLVYLFVDDRDPLEMRTPAAHKTGFALVKMAGEALQNKLNEFVVLRINGVALNFPPKGAKKVGAALLRRADDADDFQKRIH